MSQTHHVSYKAKPRGVVAAAEAMAARFLLWLFVGDDVIHRERAQARYRRWQESPYPNLRTTGAAAGTKEYGVIVKN